MKHFAAGALLSSLVMIPAVASADFKISFEWGSIPRCTSGWPGKVDSPIFQIQGLPEGTKVVEFLMTDLNAPGFMHGGGEVEVAEDGEIAAGAFTYYSPCPPNGSHTYQWTAKAKPKKGWVPKSLDTARAKRQYPE